MRNNEMAGWARSVHLDIPALREVAGLAGDLTPDRLRSAVVDMISPAAPAMDG